MASATFFTPNGSFAGNCVVSEYEEVKLASLITNEVAYFEKLCTLPNHQGEIASNETTVTLISP
jgi:hypothetical protein